MSNTNCQINWVTNTIATVIPKCPTGHCPRCNLHKPTPSPTTASLPIPPIEHSTNSSKSTHAQVTTNNGLQNNPPYTSHKPQIPWVGVPKNKAVLSSSDSHAHTRKIWARVPTPSSTKPSLPFTTTTSRWVCKDLLLTQGYYKGNTQLWIPKQNSLQAIILGSTNPRDKGKMVSQAPSTISNKKKPSPP